MTDPAVPLAQEPCRTLCSWGPTGGTRDGLPLFACGGCGSEWVRTEGWTPRQVDGSLHPEVRAEAARR